MIMIMVMTAIMMMMIMMMMQCSKLRPFWLPWQVKKNFATKIAVKVANLVTCDWQSRAKLFPRNFSRFCEIRFSST